MTVFPAKFLNFMIALVNAILLIFNTSNAAKKEVTLDLTGYELTFADRKTLRYGRAGGELKEYVYDCLKADDDTYFVK